MYRRRRGVGTDTIIIIIIMDDRKEEGRQEKEEDEKWIKESGRLVCINLTGHPFLSFSSNPLLLSHPLPLHRHHQHMYSLYSNNLWGKGENRESKCMVYIYM